MQTISLRTEIVEVIERHRALDNAACDRLAASMREIGLCQPISIRIADMMVIDGKEVEGVPVLVAGRHRLEAAKRLGWSHIECIEVDDDAVSAEMWEIAENLHRLDLTKDQRDKHIRRYAELLDGRRAKEIQAPQDAAPEIGYRKPPPQTKGVARQVAEETGLSVDTVRRALNPKPVLIKSVVEAESDEEAILREANAIVAAWNRARQAARDLALEQIDAPVFDRSRSAA